MSEIYFEMHKKCIDRCLDGEMCVIDGCVIKQA